MTTDLLLAALSLAGLLGYSTIGVAAWHLTDREVTTARRCIELAIAWIAPLAAALGYGAATTDGGVLATTCAVLLIVGTLAGLFSIPWFEDSDLPAVAPVSAALWPAVLVAHVVVGITIRLARLVVIAARGPIAWGTALARLLTGRAERRVALVRQVADRDRRIAELEREVLS